MKRSLGPLALGLPAPVWVIGSYGADGRPNIMTASWCGICCSEPPCAAVSIRKTRQSHTNIMQNRAFTINIPPRQHLVETDYLGIVSGKKVDKFAVAGLTAVRSEIVHAPLVEEFPLTLECRVLQVLDLGSHTQFIGEILDVKADGVVLDGNGRPVAWKLSPLISSAGDRAYYSLGEYLGQACQPGTVLLDSPGGRQVGRRRLYPIPTPALPLKGRESS
jgi:flavin reductase (DIM6/NTAB) family NADH-FMN oxidoreductase RutF